MRRPLIPRIDRYMFRQLMLALLAISTWMVALIWLTQSLRFVQLVVNHGLSFGVFLELSGLLIPGFLAVILPITSFVAVLFVYTRLAGDRELTVMRSSGLSPFALSRPALALLFCALALNFALNIWIVPASQTSFRQFQFEIRNRLAAFLLQEGVFTPVQDGLVVYIRQRDRDGTLHGIMIDDARDPKQHTTVLAERGRLVEGEDNPTVLLVNGSKEGVDTHTGRLNVVTFDESRFDLAQVNRSDEPRLRDVGELSLRQLLHPAQGVDPREIPRMRVEAHKRLAGPLTTFGYVMIALVAVLTGTFRRHGGILRPFAAIAAVVALVALQLALDSLAVRNMALIPLLWLHALLPGLICMLYLYRSPPRLPERDLAPAVSAAR